MYVEEEWERVGRARGMREEGELRERERGSSSFALGRKKRKVGDHDCIAEARDRHTFLDWARTNVICISITYVFASASL
jgi:hypothetical protein